MAAVLTPPLARASPFAVGGDDTIGTATIEVGVGAPVADNVTLPLDPKGSVTVSYRCAPLVDIANAVHAT